MHGSVFLLYTDFRAGGNFGLQPVNILPSFTRALGMIEFRPMGDTAENATILFSLFSQAQQFHLIIDGRLPTLDAARTALSELPPGKAPRDKLFGGYWKDNEIIGCADLIRGYPETHVAFLGLLLFSESNQGIGFGPIALRQLFDQARSWGCSELRLAVIDKNKRALGFWLSQGFRELYRKPALQYRGDAIVMQITL